MEGADWESVLANFDAESEVGVGGEEPQTSAKHDLLYCTSGEALATPSSTGPVSVDLLRDSKAPNTTTSKQCAYRNLYKILGRGFRKWVDHSLPDDAPQCPESLQPAAEIAPLINTKR